MKSVPRYFLIACTLTIALFGAAAFGYSQANVVPQVVDPVVLSGSDIGFRMTARKRDTPVGQLVVRINGEWKEVEFAFGMKPATK